MPPAAGPAHVATISFLASRAVPTGGFWVALAGGVALARVAERRGAREGFGASLAAMLESVAIMGPARAGVPLTQALSAPILGRLEARSVGRLGQFLACAGIRLLHNTATTAFFIWVITGGLDAYAGTYDAVGRRVGIELSTKHALALTAAGLLLWAVFASAVQVAVYRRGLRRWGGTGELDPAAPDTTGPRDRTHGGRFDPRAAAIAAILAFGLLLASTAWALLAAVVAWLVVAWFASRPDTSAVPQGVALAALLAGGALAFSLAAGLGLDVALRRGLRAALLVLTATWLRAAAGADGLREVFRRSLGRLGRLPALREAARTLDEIGSERRLLAAGRSLAASVRGVRRRPLPLLDALLGWVARESDRFRPAGGVAAMRLQLRARDGALMALAATPAIALLAGG